jgi:AraC-like DNA-binding protein
MLHYGQMTLTEIAFELGYNSTAYLSVSSKLLITPSYFKETVLGGGKSSKV